MMILKKVWRENSLNCFHSCPPPPCLLHWGSFNKMNVRWHEAFNFDCLPDASEDVEKNARKATDRQEDECRAVIEQIRREEFGIGLELGEEELKLVRRQREREGRGLHRLSSELYSRDTHFVLELVQNADDNSYPEYESVAGFPSLVFVLEKDKIVVLNNEVGFMEKNIRALCDVGKSTKGAHRYGYIGITAQICSHSLQYDHALTLNKTLKMTL